MISGVMTMEEERSLLFELEKYAQGGVTPMHMPGHKRNARLLGGGFPWGLDITEIEGFDDLCQPSGILRESMDRAAAIYGSLRTLFLVNGASGGLLAGIRAMTRRGDTVLLARNSHLAVYHALELCGLRAVYLRPPTDEAFGVLGSVPPASVEQALSAHPEIKLCVITSPSYSGVISDIASIAEILHARGVPLLVDEAHGAHLPFSGDFPLSAIRLGADLVVHSLHKTLPSLTQTALIHVLSERVDQNELARQLHIFQTSSPSYVLMASIDECLLWMRERGEARMRAYGARLAAFDRKVSGLRRLRVLCHGTDSLKSHPGIFAFDPGKLLIFGMDGARLMRLLREDYGFELEMSVGDCALAMTSLCDEKGEIERLAEALLEIENDLVGPVAPPSAWYDLAAPEAVMTIKRALEAPGERIETAGCAGRVAREYAWVYPPGVPLLAPGERITEALVERLAGLCAQGARLRSTSGWLPDALDTVKFDA